MNQTSKLSRSDPADVGHFINGKAVSGGTRVASVADPARGTIIRNVALAEPETVDAAVQAAIAASELWRDVTPAKRARVFFEYKKLLEENFDRIASLITEELGKTAADAGGELARGIEVVDYACGIPELLKGEYSRNAGPRIDSWSEFHSLGVVAGITPFNFPAMVPMWMFPMAIACGNAFILKPSEKDPSAAMLLAELFSQAGLPDGVFNVVNGDAQAVNAILDHDDVAAVSFVGSTPIAEAIYSRGTANGKRVQALGGAKNCAIVMPDADIHNTINALMGAAYGSSGQRCMAISVAICVGDDTADTIVEELSSRIPSLTVGFGTDPKSEMGPMISKQHLEKVRSYIELGEAEGAELVVDGRDVSVTNGEDGFFLGGCLFDKVSPEMRIFQEEIFGPVLCVVRVGSQDDAMKMINQHEYGNGTCIFTRDGEAARYFSDRIKVGMVGINVPLPVPVASHSFGGWKRSLFGDLHAYGPDSVRFYTRRKTVSARWPVGGVREKSEFAFPSG